MSNRPGETDPFDGVESAAHEDRFWQRITEQVAVGGGSRPVDLEEAEIRMGLGADDPLEPVEVLRMVREATGQDLSEGVAAAESAAEPGAALQLVREGRQPAAAKAPARGSARSAARRWLWFAGGAAAAAVAAISFMTVYWDSTQSIHTLHHEIAREMMEDPFQRMEDRNLAVIRLGGIALDSIDAMREVEGSDAVLYEEVRLRLAYLSEVLEGGAVALEIPFRPALDVLPGGGVDVSRVEMLAASRSLASRREALHRLTALASQAIVTLGSADLLEEQLRVSRAATLDRIRRKLER